MHPIEELLSETPALGGLDPAHRALIAGCTRNRVFRQGEQLMREGRLRPLTDERAIEVVKQRDHREIARRDPAVLTEMILGAVR